jgi:hypothetical protein
MPDLTPRVVARVRAARVIPFSLAALLFSIPPAARAADPAEDAAHGAWMGELKWFLLLLVAALQVVQFFRRKPPLEVEFVRREEFDKRNHELADKVDYLRAEIRADIGTLSRKFDAQEARFLEIYDRLGQLRRREPTA